MKTVNIEIQLFEFKELKSQAKARVISEHENFLIQEGIECENEKGELVREEYNPTEAEVIENIEINGYYFYENGELADVTKYVGNHPRSGEEELKVMSQTILI